MYDVPNLSPFDGLHWWLCGGRQILFGVLFSTGHMLQWVTGGIRCNLAVTVESVQRTADMLLAALLPPTTLP